MGTDKAVLPWGESTLLETIVQTVRQVSDRCVLLGHAETLPASVRSLPRLADAYGGVGPIGGLHALLAHHPGRWCLLLGCDTPGVTVGTLTTLIEQIGSAICAVAYEVSTAAHGTSAAGEGNVASRRCGRAGRRAAVSRLEPCCALYQASILPRVGAAIEAGRYGLAALIESVPHVAVPADAATRRALRNINTPGDYRAAR